MKQPVKKLCKTSSLIIDLQHSTFTKLMSANKIMRYELPKVITGSEYGVLHNWARNSLNNAYYLNTHAKCLFVLIGRHEEPGSLSYRDVTLHCSEFSNYQSHSDSHIWIKVLLAEYFRSNESFISNDSFFLNAEVSRNRNWATVLKIDTRHNYKNQSELEFTITPSATRLKQVSIEEYRKYHARDIAYGCLLKNGHTLFKQVRTNNLAEAGMIFVKPRPVAGNTFKTKLNFHSIANPREHERTKAYLLEKFTRNFTKFLEQFDIAASAKELSLSRVDNDYENARLALSGFQPSILDIRKNRTVPASQLIPSSLNVFQGITFMHKTKEMLNPGESVLLLMDFDGDDFSSIYEGEQDPYQLAKKDKKMLGMASQGMCINENTFEKRTGESDFHKEQYENYKGITGQALERNLSICISQLFLKDLILKGSAQKLPLRDLIAGKVFIAEGHALYIHNDSLNIFSIDSHEQLEEIIQAVTGRRNLYKSLEAIHQYHNPFPTSTNGFSLENYKLIVSNDSIIEVAEFPEIVFYDEPQIRQRIEDRNMKRKVVDFKSTGSDELSIAYNEFIEENVEEISISYEELLKKYGKGEDGFLITLFNAKKDTPFRKFLSENCNLQIKGEKEGGLFNQYTGIWFDESRLQYYVGKTLSYNQTQDKGFQMRKIIEHEGAFRKDDFFPLLTVDFIRYKEFTVQPFPFKLIEMKMEMEKLLTHAETY